MKSKTNSNQRNDFEEKGQQSMRLKESKEEKSDGVGGWKERPLVSVDQRTCGLD